MSVQFRMEVDQSTLDELPGNELNLMLEYLANGVRGVQEDAFDMKVGTHRVYLEREGLNLWTIYRIEEDANTVKV